MARKYHYVYALIDPRTCAPFYCGKGTGTRMVRHFQNIPKRYQGEEGQPRFERIQEIRAAGLMPTAVILSHHPTDAAALEEEKRMIDSIGLDNLTNQNAGGGGDTSKKPKNGKKQKVPTQALSVIKALTPKREAFCLAIVDPECKDQSSAYKVAFNTENMSAAVIANEASKLMQVHEITVRIAELRAALVTDYRYDMEKAIKGQERAVELADDTGAAGAMSGAYREIAKLSDLYPKEAVPDNTINVAVGVQVKLSDKELARRMAHIIEAGVINDDN